MTRFPHPAIDDDAECAVCRSDTHRLCSPCGDPVCENCLCPNGCDTHGEAEMVADADILIAA
jgi:hypothetical protein